MEQVMNNQVVSNYAKPKFKIFKDLLVLAKRSLLKVKHSPDELFDVTLMPIFFMVMFTEVFGGAIAGNTKAYLPTIVPGILIQTLLSASSSTGTQLREDLDTGVFDRFKSLPIARIAPLGGPLLADALRYLVAAVVSLATGYLMGWRPEAGIPGVAIGLVLAVFASWAISWIFAFLGILSKNAATIHTLSTLILFALTFLSNALVPLDTMPKWLQHFAMINPVTHLVSAFREATLNGVLGQEAFLTFAISSVAVLIFAPLTVKVYAKKI